MMTKHFSKSWGPQPRMLSPNIRLSMSQCVMNFFVIKPFAYRFPSYLQAAEASLESLQNAVINGSTSSTPEVKYTPTQRQVLY